MNANEKTFAPTNHLKAEADEGWIALIMGGGFHNSQRTDIPTRELRVYFTEADDYVLLEGVTDEGHGISLKGYDSPSSRGANQGWNRFTYQFLKGFQVRDLKRFTWRASYDEVVVEIRAERIGNSERWTVEYCSNATGREYGLLLESWFQMIDPDTFEIIKASTLNSLTSSAGEAAHILDDRTSRGYHSQMYEQLKILAHEQDVDISKCWGSRSISGREPNRAELSLFWKMMLELPIEEDQPTFHEGLDVLHAWKLRHVRILFERYGEMLPERFHRLSSMDTEEQVVEELVTIGQSVQAALGEPPKFSFRPYMNHINWRPATFDDTRVDRILTSVSKQLGWTMA